MLAFQAVYENNWSEMYHITLMLCHRVQKEEKTTSLTFGYGRKETSSDKPHIAVVISIVAVSIVAIYSATVSIELVYSAAIAIADDAAVLTVAVVAVHIISVCRVRTGAGGDTSSVHAGANVTVPNQTTGTMVTVGHFP